MAYKRPLPPPQNICFHKNQKKKGIEKPRLPLSSSLFLVFDALPFHSSSAHHSLLPPALSFAKGWATPDAIEGVCDIDRVSENGFVVAKESRTGRRGTLRVHNMASRKFGGLGYGALDVSGGSVGGGGVGGNGSGGGSSMDGEHGGGGGGGMTAGLEDRMRQYIPATITRVLDYARAAAPPPLAGLAPRRSLPHDAAANAAAGRPRSSTAGSSGNADLDDALANETRRLTVVFLNLGLDDREVAAAQYSVEGAQRMHAMMATVQRCCYRYQVASWSKQRHV